VPRKAPDYQRIATELATVDRILEQIAARQRRTKISAAPSAAPRTDLESQLAALWSELLGVAPVASTTASSTSAATRSWPSSYSRASAKPSTSIFR